MSELELVLWHLMLMAWISRIVCSCAIGLIVYGCWFREVWWIATGAVAILLSLPFLLKTIGM